MNEIAVRNASVNYRRRLALAIAFVAAAAMLFAPGAASVAEAKPVGKDGKIRACYKVKGKPRGSMRLLFKGKKCRRGERRVVWAAAGAPGPAGQDGAGNQGGAGGPGAAGGKGADGSSADEDLFNAKIAALTLKIENLEGILGGIDNGDLLGVIAALKGITNGDLLGVLDTLDGLTNSGLLEAVNTVPLVDSLCGQAGLLTEQANLLRTVIGGLGLNQALTLLNGLLIIPTLPVALDPFSCVAAP